LKIAADCKGGGMTDSKKRTTFLLLSGGCCAFLAVALGAFAGQVLQQIMLPE